MIRVVVIIYKGARNLDNPIQLVTVVGTLELFVFGTNQHVA